MVYAICEWCGKWKKGYAWRECVDQDDKGNELHDAMCKECYYAIWGKPCAEEEAEG